MLVERWSARKWLPDSSHVGAISAARASTANFIGFFGVASRFFSSSFTMVSDGARALAMSGFIVAIPRVLPSAAGPGRCWVTGSGLRLHVIHPRGLAGRDRAPWR